MRFYASDFRSASALAGATRGICAVGITRHTPYPVALSLKIYPWICGRCSREFVYSNLRELTVHHIDHDHTNNPEDGSNWELLCLYCHDHEHSKYTEADQYGTRVVAGEDAQKDVAAATYNPFADLKSMLNKKS